MSEGHSDNNTVRKVILIAAALAILVLTNYAIFHKERLLADGRVVLLELAPVDPRSLMQGDYMALRFKVADGVSWGRAYVPPPQDGCIVAYLDARGVAQFRRIDDGAAVAADEVRLRYRVRAGTVKLATNAFFFQEGHAQHYERARYGEFRVAGDGDLLLTALRGENMERLGPASPSR